MNALPLYYDDDYKSPDNADGNYPDYQIVQLSPADLLQAKALHEKVLLEPGSSYPSNYSLQPSYQISAVHKKDTEHLQYQPHMAKVRSLCIDLLFTFLLFQIQEISFRKTPLATIKPVDTPEVFSEQIRGMKEEAIFRPESARDQEYGGRRKRSIPPFINEKTV